MAGTYLRLVQTYIQKSSLYKSSQYMQCDLHLDGPSNGPIKDIFSLYQIHPSKGNIYWKRLAGSEAHSLNTS